MKTLMSMRQYAKHRGISAPSVSKAVAMGRITCVRDSFGRAQIDPAVADREWEENSVPYRVGNSGGKDGASTVVNPESGESGDPKKNPYAQATAVLKNYQARLAKLEFEEKAGKLHDVDGCSKEAFRIARAVRDAMLGIPDRLSAELAGETDQFKIRKLLEDEIRLALENLAAFGSEG